MKSLSLPIYDLSGKTTKQIDLDPAVFNVEPNLTLLHQVINTFLANRRAATAHTKGRGEVRGGGRKPWRQKGTGNARAGSSRSPIWRGGGVTFGPTNARNYTKRLPQKMRQGAWKMALSMKVNDDQLRVVSALDSLQGKTKDWIKAFAALPHTSEKALVVSKDKNDLADRSIRNIPTHKYVSLESLTLFDVMRFSHLILTQDAVEALTQRLSTEKATKTEKVTA